MEKYRRGAMAQVLSRVAVCLTGSMLVLLAPVSAARENGFTSAEVCRPCHQEVYRTWKSSLHPTAFSDPVFQLSYKRIRIENSRVTLLCERCHSPLRSSFSSGAPPGGDFAQEGVTCDFCHSVASVDVDGTFPRFGLEPGVRHGPYLPRKVAHGSPHERRFSSLHIHSEFCAGCHEFRNQYGVSILSTFSEWKESYYRGKEVHCQFCHLPQLFGGGSVADKERNAPLSHEMVGGHSPERLARAIPLHAHLTVSRDEARVDIRIKNDIMGHKSPGTPLHRIRLVTTLLDAKGNALGRREEFFEKVVGDGAGNPVTRPDLVFTAAREVLKDNRIAPKETRDVVHRFRTGEIRPAKASVELTYEIPTPDNVHGRRLIDIPFSTVTASIRPEVPILVVVVIVVAMLGGLLTAVWVSRRKTV